MKNRQLRKASLSERVIALVEGARQKVATAANLAQVYTNYEIGRQIVEEEQGGKRRAGYGEKIIEDLSTKLTARFGRGWSARSIRQIRQFYVEYSTDEIRRELIAKSETMNSEISDCRIGNRKDLARSSRQIQTPTGLPLTPDFVLGWTHYLILMRIEDRQERYFYEMEAEGNGWSTTDLHLQMQKQLYQRLGVAKGKDKALVEMTLPEAERKQIFARRFSAIVPSKKRLASIVLEEKRKYEKEKLLLLAAKKGARS